jgi:hypothetical protein
MKRIDLLKECVSQVNCGNLFSRIEACVIAELGDIELIESLKNWKCFSQNAQGAENLYRFLKFVILSNKMKFDKTNFSFKSGEKLYKFDQYNVQYTDLEEQRFRSLSSSFCFLYHGSSPPRFHSILRNGLKNCSGTNLQAHGAAYGNGIYATDDLNLGMSYAYGSSSKHILVVMEAIGKKSDYAKTCNIYVIPREEMQKIRFVLVIPNGTSVILSSLTAVLNKKYEACEQNIVRKKTRAQKVQEARLTKELSEMISKNIIVERGANNTLSIPLKSVGIKMFIPENFPFSAPIVWISPAKVDSPGNVSQNGLIYDINWKPVCRLWQIVDYVKSLIEKSQVIEGTFHKDEEIFAEYQQYQMIRQ